MSSEVSTSHVPACFADGAQGTFVAAALDTETSGLSHDKDQIIEIGVRLFRFELPAGRVVDSIASFSALQDPGFVISPEIVSVTGITPQMLVGQKIDWAQVDALLEKVDLVLAHNAQFDRGFVDKKSHVSREKVWGCSAWQVDWRAKGFKNARLQDLCGALGIAHQAHRAMGDVDAMFDLLGREDVMTGKPYLAEILDNCRQAVTYVWAEGRTYDQRDLLKAHGFKWNSGSQVWGKFVASAEAARQVETVQSLVPGVKVLTRQVALRDRFKPIN